MRIAWKSANEMIDAKYSIALAECEMIGLFEFLI